MKKIGIFLVLGLLLVVGLVSAYKGDYTTQGPNFSEERHELMQQAFDTGDYDAWVDLMSQDGRTPRVLEIVNEDNFDLFVQAHEAGIAGDSETAKELRAQLGLNNGVGPKDGAGFGNGMKYGRGHGQREGPKDGSRLGQGRMQGDCAFN